MLASVVTHIGLLEDGRLFFNLFIRSSQSVSEEITRGAFYKGAAILPAFRIKGADIILAIHRHRQNKLPYIIIPLKNRKNDVVGDSLRQKLCEACNDAAGLLGPAVPYLGMVMLLQSKSGDEVTKQWRWYHRCTRLNRTPDQSRDRKNKPKETPRVIITSVGLNQVASQMPN